MRIVFMGTPDFAVPSLDALQCSGWTVCGALTQPDKPKNRGMKLQATPVKEYCLTHQIPVYQPNSLRTPETLELLRGLQPDLIVVAAYGRILPEDVLNLPPVGCINVHSSLLPRYRGAAPIQWAILNGDRETGVTIMHMAKELDAGDIITQTSTPIDPEETAGMLTQRLARLGAQALADTVHLLEQGCAPRIPQDQSGVTYAPMLTRELSPVDWTRPARNIHNQIRGLLPWPAATASVAGVRCKLLASQVEEVCADLLAGTVVGTEKNGFSVACGEGSVLKILQLQPDGKKAMTAGAFLQGHPLTVGAALA